MKSGKTFVLVFLLPIVIIKTEVLDLFDVFYDDDNKDDIQPFDSTEFEKDLRKSLYGQHIALETILKAVSTFIKDPNPSKPLVLFLHGSSGVGKSYVTDIISRNIYEIVEKRKHVHTFIATYHFPQKTESAKYEAQLKQWIHEKVSRFSRSMFIFEDLDKMNSHLIDTLKPFLDYLPYVDGVSFRKAIFIFISNTGGHAIGDLALDFWRKGKDREEIQMDTNEMETQMHQGIFNENDSEFWHSSIIDHHLVDHFIPFLPLERKHVRQCVLAEMNKKNIILDHDLAETVAREMAFFPPQEEIFSLKGCKTVRQKLLLYVDD